MGKTLRWQRYKLSLSVLVTEAHRTPIATVLSLAIYASVTAEGILSVVWSNEIGVLSEWLRNV